MDSSFVGAEEGYQEAVYGYDGMRAAGAIAWTTEKATARRGREACRESVSLVPSLRRRYHTRYTKTVRG